MLFIITVLTLLTIYLVFDYTGPAEIRLQPGITFDISCLKAKDLIVQESDDQGNLWATRGMIIYKLAAGEHKFKRTARVSTGRSVFWLNNFTMIRWLTKKPECVELVVSGDGKFCAFAAGYMFYGDRQSKKFEKQLKLPQYGIGVGRGMMSPGFLKVDDRLLFFGEYFRNDERTQVNIYRSHNFGQTWEVAYRFEPGEICHIHALQKDPYTDKLWICTGDYDHEPMIGWSDDHFETIHFIGQGSQVWRACQLVFTEEAILWGTDTGSEDLAGIYRWDKKSSQLTRLKQISGAVFFGTRLNHRGKIVMSTDREGFPNERDDKTKLYVISEDNQVTTIECGAWNRKKPGFQFDYAKSRFQRNQGSDFLAVNFLNQKEVRDGDLVLISEDQLNEMTSKYESTKSRKVKNSPERTEFE
jgi:hypothetical protein